MGTKTLDQQRAEHAWNAVVALRQKDAKEAEHYQGEAKKLPVRIMTAGLGHSLAFLSAKSKGSKTGLKHLLVDLASWVIKGRPLEKAVSKDNLLESVIKGDAEFLELATDETLAYLRWLNRFLEADRGEARIESE